MDERPSVQGDEGTAHQQAALRKFTGFQNYCEQVLKVPAHVCNTHVSAIPANNGSFKKRFAFQDVYKQFYDFVVL